LHVRNIVKHPLQLNPIVNSNSTWLKFTAWLAVSAWAGAIFWLSSRTGSEIETLNIFDVWDKAAHFTAFFAGAVALVIALRWSTKWTWTRIAIFTVIAISLYGASDEYHQLYTPHRSGADIGDWLADSLGAAAGTLLTVFIHARSTRPHRPTPARA
jgi:VanZ family protein